MDFFCKCVLRFLVNDFCLYLRKLVLVILLSLIYCRMGCYSTINRLSEKEERCHDLTEVQKLENNQHFKNFDFHHNGLRSYHFQSFMQANMDRKCI